MEVKTSTKRER